MSPTSRATWLNPINLAREAMPPFYPPTESRRHNASGRRATGLLKQLVEAGVQLGESLGGHKDGVPLVGVAGNQWERPARTVANDDDGRSAGPRGPGHEYGVA